MITYWLGRARVTDPVRFRGYADRAPGIVLAHGGKFLATGERSLVLEGAPPYDRFFVVEFPSFEQAEACFRSADYQHAASLRQGAGEVEVVIVEAAEAPFPPL